MASSGQALSIPLPEPDDGRRVPSAIRRGLVFAGVGLLYLAIAIGFFATIWFTPGGPSSTALGVGGDPQLAIWFLRWQEFALAHGHNLLFTTYLDAPQGVNLMWNTTAPVLGVALAPLTATLGGVFAYNVAETLGLATSAMAAFVMIRRYVQATDATGTIAALVGGALYGFSPYMAAHAWTICSSARHDGQLEAAWLSGCWLRCSYFCGKNCCSRRRWSERSGSWCSLPSARSPDRPSRCQPSFGSAGAMPPGASWRHSPHSCYSRVDRWRCSSSVRRRFMGRSGPPINS